LCTLRIFFFTKLEELESPYMILFERKLKFYKRNNQKQRLKKQKKREEEDEERKTDYNRF